MSAAVTHDVPFLNVMDPTFDFGSAEVMQAQAKSWYAESPIGLLVLRYAEAMELMRDQRLNHNGKGYLAQYGIVDGPIYDWFIPMIGNQDGEEHRRLRRLVSKAFTPRMVDGMAPYSRDTAKRLADLIVPGEVHDFVEDFANPFPLAVMSQLLGVPDEDFETFRRWTTDIGLIFSLVHGGDTRARVEAAIVGLNEYVDILVELKRSKPGDDLVSALIAVRDVDAKVTEDELRNLLVTLIFAAHDTTRHQLSNAMVAFADHPDQWLELGRRPELAVQAVEEVMRWMPASNSLYRFAVEDIEFRGLHIPTGTFLTMCVVATQRDPRVFERGDVFDITLERETAPLQFGGGPHFCLGAALARVELREALPVIASRLGPPSIAGEFTWRPPIGICGPNELPLRFGG